MIKIPDGEEQQAVLSAKLTFLKIIPLAEIDNDDVQLVCTSFRAGFACLKAALRELDEHYSYFFNWHKTNHMINVFYFER